eukprot:757235-Hanusia_phi.AAC.5
MGVGVLYYPRKYRVPGVGVPNLQAVSVDHTLAGVGVRVGVMGRGSEVREKGVVLSDKISPETTTTPSADQISME